MTGICGTCGHEAEATESNEGYSDCCNDRIEYGMEAMETRLRCECDTQRAIIQTRKRIASLASQVSRQKRVIADEEQFGAEYTVGRDHLAKLEAELANHRAWQKRNKAELKYLAGLINK